jgi:hypothetical protein
MVTCTKHWSIQQRVQREKVGSSWIKQSGQDRVIQRVKIGDKATAASFYLWGATYKSVINLALRRMNVSTVSSLEIMSALTSMPGWIGYWRALFTSNGLSGWIVTS